MEFIVSLTITAVAYGSFPLIFSSLRKKDITKKKYRTICYVVNIIVMIAFGVVNGGKMSLGPYLLWTTVFVWWGIHILDNRYVLDDPSDESDTVEVRKESAPSKFTASSERYRCDSIKRLSAPYQGTCLMCRATSSVAKYRIKNEVGTREIPICEDCANKFRGNDSELLGTDSSHKDQAKQQITLTKEEFGQAYISTCILISGGQYTKLCEDLEHKFVYKDYLTFLLFLLFIAHKILEQKHSESDAKLIATNAIDGIVDQLEAVAKDKKSDLKYILERQYFDIICDPDIDIYTEQGLRTLTKDFLCDIGIENDFLGNISVFAHFSSFIIHHTSDVLNEDIVIRDNSTPKAR